MAAVIADANFLLRFLTKYPEPMYRAALAFALKAEEEGTRIEVHPVHVAEVIYVLEGRVYGLSPEAAARELLALLGARPFAPREEEALITALEAYPDSCLDFPDVFLAKLAQVEGKRAISFDKKLARIGVEPLEPETD